MTAGSNRTRKEVLFDQFVDILVEITAPDPTTQKPANPGAAMANVVRQFIKDQNISVDEDLHAGVQKLKENARALPFDDKPDDDDA